MERVRAFVRDPGDEDSFATLALAAFAFQYQRIEPYRRFCDGRGATPASVGDWRQVPAVPASAFKSVELSAAPAEEVFRSSGTSAGEGRRSVHHHPSPTSTATPSTPPSPAIVWKASATRRCSRWCPRARPCPTPASRS